MIQAASTTIISFPELGWGPWTLNRFLVEDLFGSLSIAWYGVIICLGMILGCSVALRLATKKEGFLFDSFLDYFIFCIPLGVVGARLMYVLSKWEDYDSFMEMIAIWNGGIAIYGAVIAGALTILLVAKCKKQNPLKVFDALVPGLLLAQAIGRWGNFVNGEAHGEKMTSPLPWGMMINGDGPFHPTFLYESLITFTGFLLAIFVVYRLKKIDGQVFCFYLVWYGIGRTLVEGLRTDSLMIGSLRLAQCIGIATSLGGIALGVILYLVHSNRTRAPEGVEPEVKETEETCVTEETVENALEEGTLPEEDGGEEKEEQALEKNEEDQTDLDEKNTEEEHGSTDH